MLSSAKMKEQSEYIGTDDLPNSESNGSQDRDSRLWIAGGTTRR